MSPTSCALVTLINAALEAGWPGFEAIHRLPLSAIAEAHEVIENRTVQGRLVVTLEQ
jgi:hypothetical protein